MHKHLSTALSIVLVSLLSLSSAQAEETALYYILDGSGSMWGRVEGRAKIQIAKDVMSELVNEMPAEVHSGLTVYGHRRKGDCSDIEEVVSLGKLNKQEALSQIKRIKPKGKTPIASSIKDSVERLKGTEYKSTVVLVSDGIETCDKDPCAVTKALKESGVDFVMHVVGFDVSGKTVDQLACIAEAGGGKYFEASNAGDLLGALQSVKKSVVEKTAVVIPKPELEPTPEPEKITQNVTKGSSSIRIKAKGPGRIKFKHHAWLKRPYRWMLIDPETGEEKGSFSQLSEQMVTPGVYQIAWDQFQHEGATIPLSEVVTIESGKVTEVSLLTAMNLQLPTWVKRPYYWGLVDPETGEKAAQFNILGQPVIVPAGEYDLVWRQTEHGSNEIVLQRLNLEADKENMVKATTALNPVVAEWVPKDLRYWGLKDKNKPNSPVSHRFGRFEPYLVPHGEYLLAHRWNEHKSGEALLGEVKIKEGEMNEFKVNTGVKLIPPAGTKDPYLVEFVELDANGKEIHKIPMWHTFGPIPLKAGTYRINYHQDEHATSKMTIVDSFELPAGNLVEIEL